MSDRIELSILLAGASFAAFVLAEFGLTNALGYTPTTDGAIYLILAAHFLFQWKSRNSS